MPLIFVVTKLNYMNITLWALQSLLALTFLYSGVCKFIYSERKLVASGQTGVEGLPLPLIRFIGGSEILGSIGIILPFILHIFPILTSVSAACFALIMIPAAFIHFRRQEYKNVMTNCVLFFMSLFVAYGRFVL